MNEREEKLDWFEINILPHVTIVRRRLRRSVGSEDELDDLISEVLVRVYATDNWRSITAGASYLFTVARNYLIDVARRRKIVAMDAIPDPDLLEAPYDAEAHLSARSQLQRLQRILDDLPKQARTVFIKKRIQEKSLKEIAVEMKLSVSTVEKHLAKAILHLSLALAEDEDASLEHPTVSAERYFRNRSGSRGAFRKAGRGL